jgi:hypothetical protein
MAARSDKANKAYLYGCNNPECRVTLFCTPRTNLVTCPACKVEGEFIRRPLPDNVPRPTV